MGGYDKNKNFPSDVTSWDKDGNGIPDNYFYATDPGQLESSLSKVFSTVAKTASTAAAVATNSTRIESTTQNLIYQARFNSGDWSGQLLAFPINVDGTIGKYIWDAGQILPTPAARNIYTYDTTSNTGIPFQWASLTTTQKSDLNTDSTGVVDSHGQDRLAYLRGDTSLEQRNSGGIFRNRKQTVLGDIVNSDPFFVGGQNYGYDSLPATEGGGTTYTDYLTTTAARVPVVYVGANDGMLHAFNADDGSELFAYVPDAAFPDLSQLTAPDYQHRYFVDGSPRAGDAYFSSDSSWHTVLVSGMGAGGSGVFALDVTQPDQFTASDVLWEVSKANPSFADLGYTIGSASIVRLQTGWVAIFGNGYESSSGKAVLYIVDLQTGNLLAAIDTGVGSATLPNGLSAPLPVDVDGDRIADYIYAGDLQGNMWKFDVTGTTVSKWGVALKSKGSPAPLFTAPLRSDGSPQAITSRPAAGYNPKGGLIVFFGTGKYFEKGDNTVPASPPVDALYGIKDDMTDNKSLSIADLLQQSILEETTAASGASVRVTSNNAMTTEKGWYMNLQSPTAGGQGERVVSSPLLRHGRVVFVTLIPSPEPCDYGGTSWIMELNSLTGQRLDYSAFDFNNDNQYDKNDYVDTSTTSGGTGTGTGPGGSAGGGGKVQASGLQSDVGIVRTPNNTMESGNSEFKPMAGSTGKIVLVKEKNGGAIGKGRRSWRQLQ